MTQVLRSFAARVAATFSDFWQLFFGFEEEDNTSEKAKKVAESAAILAFYELTNWWGFILFTAIIGGMTAAGYALWKILTVGFIYDLIFASVYLFGSIKSGKDLTLGTNFRRGIDSVFQRGGVTKFVGYCIFAVTLVAANIWNGPEQILMMVMPEIQTRWKENLGKIIVGVVGLTLLQTIPLGIPLWGIAEGVLWLIR